MANWTYRTDGDYSHFEAQFDDMITKYCGDAATFQAGVSSSGDESAMSVFDSLSRPSTAETLRTVLKDHTLSPYIASKASWITFCVVAVLYLITCCVLAAGINKRFRNCCAKKCRGACRDRPRAPLSEEAQSRRCRPVKICSALLLVVMFALAITTMVFSGKVGTGQSAMTCDFWLTMKAHYFGVGNVEFGPGVVTDWKGSRPQLLMMQDVAERVNPKLEPQCPMCSDVYAKFEGTDGLKPALDDSRNNVMKESALAIFLLHTLEEVVKKHKQINPAQSAEFGAIPKVVKAVTMWFPFDLSVSMRLWNTGLLKAQLMKYSRDLDTTTNDGINLFDQNLGLYLDSESTVLRSSYGTAMTSVAALKEVDAVMAGLIEMWDTSLAPLMSTLLGTVQGLGFAIGSALIIITVFGGILMYLVTKETKSGDVPGPRSIKSLSAMFVLLILFSGITFVLSAALFLIGSVGRDGCSFIEQIAYDEGNWQILPPKLWNSTVYTNIPTVLDTCVKETGDGEIASALGIELLLTKLKQGVTQSESALKAKVEAKLDLSFKEEKTKALVQMTKNCNQELTVGTVYVGCNKGHETKCAADDDPTDLDNYYAIKPFISDERPSYLGALGTIAGVKFPEDKSQLLGYLLSVSGNLASFIGTILLDPIQVTVGLNVAFEKLKNEVAISMEGAVGLDVYTEFCLAAMVTEPTKGLYSDYTCCDQSSPGCLIIDFTKDHFGGSSDVSLKVLRTLDLFKIGTLYGRRYAGVYSMLYQLVILDHFLRAPLSTLGLSTKLDALPTGIDLASMLPEGTDIKTFRLVDALYKFFPEAIADPVPKPAAASGGSRAGELAPFACREKNECTLGHIVHLATRKLDVVGDTLLEAFELANNRITKFVDDTIATFKNQLAQADEGLKKFNCQIVGTAMKEGVKAELCAVVMPSVAFIALISVLLWVFAGLGAIAAWKIYHYFADMTDPDVKHLASMGIPKGFMGHAEG